MQVFGWGKSMRHWTNIGRPTNGVPLIPNTLCAYIPRIEAARQPDIRGALDDGPAVRKYGHLIRPSKKPQREFVSAHLAQRQQRCLEPVQVERPCALVNLHGVASAQADGRAAAALQIRKI